MVMESLQRLDPPRRLGKLTLLARVGEGGMASVYVASVGDGPLARLAAVKLLRAGVPDMDYRGRFVDEAKVVVRLHHNNIVDVREASEVDGQLYILMELIEGRDLSDVWDRCAQKGKAFPIPIAVHLVREILRGLHYAHTFPGLALVHRDISPSNILIDWAGAVRLADFGLATSAMKASMTVPGVVFGKVGYMAPEQALSEDLDGRADVYSCGVVLWELITGRPLRGAGTDTQAVADWRAARASELSKRVDDSLDGIVARALSNEREQRYESAQAFMRALSDWLAANAPDTTQETVAAFMLRLFGDARERDHAAYTALLEHAPRTAEFRRTRATRFPAPPTEEERIKPGTELAERYRVERTLGRGGMGVVYLAEHMGVGRQVAVKVLTHDWSRHEVVAKRFKEEARAANAANHPNIVEVYDAGRLADGRLYMAMEYLTGRSLYEAICDDGPLSPVRACEVIGAVADAIGAAHHVGIVHRDLKPDNVMLVPEVNGHRVKVLDFGISASAVRSAEEQRLTRPGHCVGTPEYMAPEQAKGHDPTPRFDVYALGVMLYEALCGDPPFVSENMVEVLTRKATEPPPPLADRVPGLPDALVEVCHACLEVDPDLRPQTADQVAETLHAIEESLRKGSTMPSPTAMPAPIFVEPRPEKPPVSASLPAARRRRMWMGGLASVAVVAVALLAWQLSVARARSQRGDVVAASSAEPPLPEPAIEDAPANAVDPTPRAEPDPPAEPDPAPPDDPEPSNPDPVPATPEPGTEPEPSTPEPEASKPKAPRVSAAKSQACIDARAQAASALGKAQWGKAYGLAKPKKCWKGHGAERTRILVNASFQQGKFSECVKAGSRSKNAEIKRIVRACQAKQ